MDRPALDRRQRLVKAAVEQFHKKGYVRTNAVDVEQAADLPGESLFSYFRTKDDLARAVVDEWCSRISTVLTGLESLPDPWQRLDGFVRRAHSNSHIYSTIGCPLAGLTRDLSQENDSLRAEVPRIYDLQLKWITKQFQAAGFSRSDADIYARSLMSRYHGAILLGFAQNDKALIDQEATRLQSWLASVRLNSEPAL